MRPLPEQSLESRALNTATLLFAGMALLVATFYVDVSHVQTSGYIITPRDIANAYYGPGMGMDTLISLAHIHMMALTPVFWVIGYIFIHSTISPRWRAFWAVLPFAAFLVDVIGWFLTHYHPGFVYQVIIGGGTFITSLGVMILVSLYELWIVPWKTRSAARSPAPTQ